MPGLSLFISSKGTMDKEEATLPHPTPPGELRKVWCGLFESEWSRAIPGLLTK